MKKGKLIIVWLLYGTVTHAQSSQVKVYLQQIVANKVLIEYIQKGYKIARTGLTTIGNIKNGEFNLHQNFFASLKAVNPKIKKSAKVIELVIIQAEIIKMYKSIYHRLKDSNQFTDREINYIYTVFERLLDDTVNTMDELLKVITSSQYLMSDDERIQRINKLQSEMKSNYAFVRRFGNNSILLSTQRIKEQQAVDLSRSLYGLPPTP